MNINSIRRDFPIFENPEKPGKSIVYLDSACMSLRPMQVISKINEYYKEYPACGARSIHRLSKKVNEEVLLARNKIKKLINAQKPEEIIFTKNTTESINILSNSLSLKPNDVILTTDKEHNSNLLPWQKFRNIPVSTDRKTGEFDIDGFQEKIISSKAKLVSVVHTSNLDGTAMPVKEIIKIAHENNILVHIDGAQSAPHKEINLKKLDTDFFSFSGHKMLGPSGIGVLYGKLHLLEKLKPFMLGGETVTESTYSSYKLAELPERLEPGLQNYAGITGLGAAADYLIKTGLEDISEHEKELNKLITSELLDGKDLELIGPEEPSKRAGIFSFNIKNLDPHSIAIMLDTSDNIAIRSGAHCVHSWFNKHNLNGSARASLYLYNTKEECERFVSGVKKIIRINS